MDPMDVDIVLAVPDTPDRSSTQNAAAQTGLGNQNGSLRSGQLGKGNGFCEESKNWTTNCDYVGGRQTYPTRGLMRSGKSVLHSNSKAFDSGDSSSNKKTSSYRKELARKGLIYENKNSDYRPVVQTKKPLFIAQSSSTRGRSVVDLTESNGHTPELIESFPSDVGVTLADEFKKGTVLVNSRSSYIGGNSPIVLHNANGEGLFNLEKYNSSSDCVDHDEKSNGVNVHERNSDSLIDNSISIPRTTRQKRLVRNGCINPINIAKGKRPVEKDNSGSRFMEQNDSGPLVSNATINEIVIRDVVSEDYNPPSLKGKEVLMKESDVSRKPVKMNERATGYGNASRDAVISSANFDGWRTTHSQSRRLNSSVSRKAQLISIEDDSPSSVSQSSGNKVVRIGSEDNASTIHHGLNFQISDAPGRPARHTSSQHRTRLSGSNGCYISKNALPKRQKQGSSSSSHAECSRSAADDSDIMLVGSPGRTTRSQSTKNQNQNGVGYIESVTEIDAATPEVQHVSSHGTGCSGSNEDATATQLELDEMLARELQEQFYSEEFSVGTSEIDARIAMAMQREEASHRAVSRAHQSVSNRRGSLVANSSGQSSSRSHLNLSRRGAHARAPTSSRIARLRNPFPGRPRTISSSGGRNSTTISARERNSLFPASMDVEVRMHILEALESFSDMGVGSSFLQMQRDFNENDYEMLLALDDNNHQHGGATTRQINGLPQSTVQTDSLEEACAICLDTPTMGDTIRHLPCLHKFHKDCIDPWLNRRTSCPVCKSSVT